MNKEIEKALDKALDNIVRDYETMEILDLAFDKLVQTKKDHDTIFNAMKALTPPTEEEVCILLGEMIEENNVKYDKENKTFYIIDEFTEERDELVWLEDESLEIYTSLPLDVIKKIIQFYEGLDNE